MRVQEQFVELVGCCLQFIQRNEAKHACSEQKVCGVHPSFQRDLAQMFKCLGATHAVNSLKTRYQEEGNADKLSHLPMCKQAENFKQVLILKCDTYRTYPGVTESMQGFYVEDKSKFEAFTDLDGLIFLVVIKERQTFKNKAKIVVQRAKIAILGSFSHLHIYSPTVVLPWLNMQTQGYMHRV